MHLHSYLDLLVTSEGVLAGAHGTVADGHAADADVTFACTAFAEECDEHARALAPVRDRYADRAAPAPDRLHPSAPGPARAGAIGLLRDLADLHQLATLVETTWQLVGQAAQGARDTELVGLASRCPAETTAQLAWLTMRMRADAAQTLLVAP